MTIKGLITRLIKFISNEIDNVLENSLKEEYIIQDCRQKSHNHKDKPQNPIWYEKVYYKDEKGDMRWGFDIWGFGYCDAFDYCKDIWLAFGHNIVLLEYEDMIMTITWVFNINDMSCIWCFNDFPQYHYIFPGEETEENLNKLESYIKVIVDELNRLAIEKRIEPL